MAFLSACALSASLAGCYAPTYRHTVHMFGKVDVEADARLAEHAQTLPWQPEAADVRLVVGVLPEGLTYSEDSGAPVVAPGYEQRYQLLGTATSEVPNAALRALFWYAQPHVTAPRYVLPLCKWQAPLRAVTLGLWSLVPLSYPCFPTQESDLRIHAGELRRAARSMGGNLVVLTDAKHFQVFDRYGNLISQHEDVSMTGYVLLDRGAQHQAPPSGEES